MQADSSHLLAPLMERKLRRHGGDVRASLAAVADVRARDIIKSINDPDVNQWGCVGEDRRGGEVAGGAAGGGGE